MFWVISVYFNGRNILPKSGTFPPGIYIYSYVTKSVKKFTSDAVHFQSISHVDFDRIYPTRRTNLPFTQYMSIRRRKGGCLLVHVVMKPAAILALTSPKTVLLITRIVHTETTLTYQTITGFRLDRTAIRKYMLKSVTQHQILPGL